MNFIKYKKNCSIKKLQRKYVILNEETGRYLITNQTGKKILDIIDEGISFNDLIEIYAQKFNLNTSKAEIDVKEFLNIAFELDVLISD